MDARGDIVDAPTIDVNADVGELDDTDVDARLLTMITSANVACGGHAGDHASMIRVCKIAATHAVAIGAQISYPDRPGFGRRRLQIPPSMLRDSLQQQLSDLREIAESHSTGVAYLKPHGALYHAAIEDAGIAHIVVDLAAEHRMPVLTMGIGHLQSLADQARVPVFHEAFIDRGYTPQGQLVPRDQPGALLDQDEAVQRLAAWAQQDFLGAHSLCVHSDTPGAVSLAEQVRLTLHKQGVRVRAFATPPGLG